MSQAHRAFVESWFERRAGESLPLLALDSLLTLWARAGRSLSPLSLAALMRCAVEAAAARHPLLLGVSVGPGGFEAESLLHAPSEELRDALGGLLVEILSVVGETAGPSLASALESELLRVGGSRRTPAGGVKRFRAG
jgi:hypothetical protein